MLHIFLIHFIFKSINFKSIPVKQYLSMRIELFMSFIRYMSRKYSMKNENSTILTRKVFLLDSSKHLTRDTRRDADTIML